MSSLETNYTEIVHGLKDKYVTYPFAISVETKAYCNADCSFCPYSSLERKGTELPDELIDKICKEIGTFPEDHPLNIVLARVNETFLDKRWLTICEKLKAAKKNVTFGFFSNGTTLTERIIDKLNSLGGVQYLNVSLNYSDPNEHLINMKIDFERVIKNLDNLHRLKKEGLFKPLVVISRVGTGDARDDDFIEFVSNRYSGFRLKVASKSNWLGNIEVDEKFDIPSSPCRQWFQLHILADGSQAFCCMDSEGEYGFGNISQNTLLEMYNHPELLRLRKTLPPRAEHAVCSSCVLLP